MGFWIFMFVMDLMIPVSMIVFGRIFTKRAPGEINGVYGYRTSMSMKNKETWKFAHRYFGRLWYVWGWMLVPVSAIVMFFVIGKDQDAVGTVGGVLCFLQMIPMLGAIVLTERELRKKFDRNGNRRVK
ncbi:MAG: SdpI family protein [Blautia sp.]|nr:SdpI family protein [Blautia sp.]MDY4516054.1 SdpI family protein [Lachnospiraceae bacterium]